MRGRLTLEQIKAHTAALRAERVATQPMLDAVYEVEMRAPRSDEWLDAWREGAPNSDHPAE